MGGRLPQLDGAANGFSQSCCNCYLPAPGHGFHTQVACQQFVIDTPSRFPGDIDGQNVQYLRHTRSFVGDATFSPVCSKANCCPMSGPLMLPVKANRMGWNRRFPFLVSALPFACVTRAHGMCVASCFSRNTPKIKSMVQPCLT